MRLEEIPRLKPASERTRVKSTPTQVVVVALGATVIIALFTGGAYLVLSYRVSLGLRVMLGIPIVVLAYIGYSQVRSRVFFLFYPTDSLE